MPSVINARVLASLLALAGLTPQLALADAHGKSVCIRGTQIDHTEIPNDNTILFFMRHHVVWKNTLASPCVGLATSDRGYSFEPTISGTDEICSNLVTIRVRGLGQTCLLGEFTQVEPKQPAG